MSLLKESAGTLVSEVTKLLRKKYEKLRLRISATTKTSLGRPVFQVSLICVKSGEVVRTTEVFNDVDVLAMVRAAQFMGTDPLEAFDALNDKYLHRDRAFDKMRDFAQMYGLGLRNLDADGRIIDSNLNNTRHAFTTGGAGGSVGYGLSAYGGVSIDTHEEGSGRLDISRAIGIDMAAVERTLNPRPDVFIGGFTLSEPASEQMEGPPIPRREYRVQGPTGRVHPALTVEQDRLIIHFGSTTGFREVRISDLTVGEEGVVIGSVAIDGREPQRADFENLRVRDGDAGAGEEVAGEGRPHQTDSD